MEARTEEAFEFLVKHLAQFHLTTNVQQLVSLRYAHLYIPDITFHFWRQRDPKTMAAEMTALQYQPFYDAAWELARIGVIRPGRFAPAGREHPMDFGDLWSITAYGFAWLAEAGNRPFIDMGRISEIFAGFVALFGPGFGQRAVEAVRTYRTGNYLASCAMVGAAAESILLAVAIAKSGDEPKMMKMYESMGGRGRTTQFVIGQAKASLARQFEAALHILHYWRDDAAHGALTTITEVETHAALSELLRLAQFSSDNWDELTK